MAKSRLKLKFSDSISGFCCCCCLCFSQYTVSRSKRTGNENVAQTSKLALENFANSKSVVKICLL